VVDFNPAVLQSKGLSASTCAPKPARGSKETARLCDLVENSIRREVPANELENILDNIGLAHSSINYQHGSCGVLGASEADVPVSLHEKHHPMPTISPRCGMCCPPTFAAPPFVSCRRIWLPKI
jgi:hypothetical protein